MSDNLITWKDLKNFTATLSEADLKKVVSSFDSSGSESLFTEIRRSNKTEDLFLRAI
jgi:hypothetical protein